MSTVRDALINYQIADLFVRLLPSPRLDLLGIGKRSNMQGGGKNDERIRC